MKAASALATALIVAAAIVICPPPPAAVAQTTAPTSTPVADLMKGPIDPLDFGSERALFFAAAGVDSELTAEKFAADQKTGKGFVRSYDTWDAMLAFDKNADKKIDWAEAQAYRQDILKRLLTAFDADKDGKLTGKERDAANAALAEGKIPAGPVPVPTYRVFPGGVVAGSTVPGGLAAAFAAATTRPVTPVLNAQTPALLAIIKDACGLSDDQVKKMQAIEGARKKAIDDWYKDNINRIKGTADEVNEAVEKWKATSDPELKKKYWAEGQAAMKENFAIGAKREAIDTETKEALWAALSDEQKAKWQEHLAAERAAIIARQRLRQYNEMAKAAGLSDEQVRKMVSIDEERDRAVAKWEQDHAEELAAMRQATADAMKENDPAKLGQLMSDSAKLREPMMELINKSRVDVTAVMSDEQRAKWQEHTTMKTITDQWFVQAQLTDEQKAEAREAYAKLAAESGATPDSILHKLSEQVKAMLTDEQLKKNGMRK